MTATVTPARSADALAAAATAAPRRSTPRRRSPAMVSLGVVLVAVCALAAWQYVSAGTPGTRAYVAVYQDVPAGQQLTAADLQVVSITPVAGLAPVPASGLSSVVGQYATVPLVAGTLLTAAEVAGQRTIAAGHAVLGISVTGLQRPARLLHAGDQVRLVEVPSANGADDSASANALPLAPLSVTVADVSPVGDDGTVVVDVFVADGNVSAVAALAATGRIAIVVIPAG